MMAGCALYSCAPVRCRLSVPRFSCKVPVRNQGIDGRCDFAARWGCLLKAGRSLTRAQTALRHFPALDLASQFARPVFFGAGHEHLPSALGDRVEQRHPAAAPLQIQFPHHVVNQQHRRMAMGVPEELRLRHLKGERHCPFLAFTAEPAGRPIIDRQIEIIPVRSNQGEPLRSFTPARLGQVHGKITTNLGLVGQLQALTPGGGNVSVGGLDEGDDPRQEPCPGANDGCPGLLRPRPPLASPGGISQTAA